MKDNRITGRFAPSPSGRLHLGNLMCCLLAWLSAKQKDGKILLRIEDVDTERCRREYAAQMLDDLAWLGFTFDEGTACEPVYQSERGDYYGRMLRRLSKCAEVYPCFCTRAELHAASAPHRDDGDVIYPGTCRHLSAEQVAKKQKNGNSGAIRIAVPDERIEFEDGHLGAYSENLLRDCGDFVLRRSNGMYAYQLAVVADDGMMGVGEVVRGADLLASTPRQIYLYRLLNLPVPRFYHFPMLLSADGRRLSKRDGSTGLDTLRGVLPPREILGRLAYLAGFNPSAKGKSAEELLKDFSWEHVPTEDICIPKGLFE